MPINALNSSDPWIGRRLGDEQRYRLDRRLGGGAVGDVYLAMDVRLGRQVAIKILKGVLAKSPELLARFEREVALSVALNSEHIVQVIDYGIALEKHRFYVMEYLQGETLSQFLGRKGRLSVEQTIVIANQLCAGLKIAHEGVTLWKNQATESERIKIIHRDLKPANIFLVNTGLGELVKILDFGIAKKLHTDEQAEQTNLTQAFLGTFRYAAPEQLRNASKLDERADIYSLGMILYEMLSGTDPFGILAKTLAKVEQSWGMAHVSIEPTPLRQQPGCEQLPIELETAVMRCLRKPAADRFASVAELSRSLNQIRQGLHQVMSSQAFTPVVPDEALDPTVAHPLVMPEPGPTLYRPIVPSVVPQSSSTATRSSDQSLPQPSTDQPAIDSIVPMAETNSSDYTIVQNPSGSQPVDGTIVQHPPALPSRDISDQTIAQFSSPPTPSSTDRDTTRFQAPRTASDPDATRFQGSSVVHGAASRQTGNSPNSGSSQAQEARSPAPAHPASAQDNSTQGRRDGLVGQAEEWLRSTASNYVGRIRAQAQAEVRHGAYRIVARFLPVGIGFAFGLAAMSGAYHLFRSKLHLPFPSKPSPTIFK